MAGARVSQTCRPEAARVGLSEGQAKCGVPTELRNVRHVQTGFATLCCCIGTGLAYGR